MSYKYKKYEESDAVKKLANDYNALKAAAPGEYKSGYQTQIDDILSRIRNREKFNYDPSTDPFAKQYEDMYRRQAKLGMQDTMGQAAALTGGYGNSYATAAGQQIYNQHMQEMSAMYPELYQLAYSRYQDEGQGMLDEYNLLMAQDADAYAKHRDKVGDYYTDLTNLANEYQNAKTEDYNMFLADREADYQAYADMLDYNASMAKAYASGGGDEDELALWNYSKASEIDSNKNEYFIYNSTDGKRKKVVLGENPYNGDINKDILDDSGNVDPSKLFRTEVKDENGKVKKDRNGNIEYTYSNTYQPNNVDGQPLTKTEARTNKNGRDQAIWMTSDGKLWVWDGTKNKYDEIEIID